MEKIRILQSIRQGKIGGGERHVLDLVNYLDKDRFEPVVLSFTDGEMIDSLKAMNVETHVLKTEKPFDVRIWKSVARLTHKLKVDLIHSHGTRACSNCYWTAKKLNISSLYTIHGWSFHPNQSFFVQKIREKCERFLTKQTNLNILVSNGNLEEGVQKLGISNSIVIKNGVNLDVFNINQIVNDHSDFRSQIGVKEDELLVGLIARITIQKDPITFIKAAERVISENKKIKFLIVGDGEMKRKSIEYAKAKNIEDKCIFLDFRSDVPAILKAIDIYCLPSLWEGLPIGIIEAMAMGKPIVATAITGTIELVHHRDNGILFPIKNHIRLAESIMELASNHTLRIEMGIKSRMKVEEDYDIKKMVKDVEKVYESVYQEKLVTTKTQLVNA